MAGNSESQRSNNQVAEARLAVAAVVVGLPGGMAAILPHPLSGHLELVHWLPSSHFATAKNNCCEVCP